MVVDVRMGLGEDLPLLEGVVLSGTARMAVDAEFHPNITWLGNDDDGLEHRIECALGGHHLINHDGIEGGLELAVFDKHGIRLHRGLRHV